ncbi:MAG: HU family DNA-binding protein [Mycoplasma sp.]
MTNKPMTKNEILRNIVEISGVNGVELNLKQANIILESYEKVLLKEWKNNGEFKLLNIGKFKVKAKKEREGINPITKEKVIYPAKDVPVFKFNKAVKEFIQTEIKK